jgi:hypothetical protein
MGGQANLKNDKKYNDRHASKYHKEVKRILKKPSKNSCIE